MPVRYKLTGDSIEPKASHGSSLHRIQNADRMEAEGASGRECGVESGYEK